MDASELPNHRLMVGLIDIATANNTVAIVMANPIAKEMAQKYDITDRKSTRLNSSH